MKIALALALIAAICAALLARENARGAELLTNGGFENSTTGWVPSDGSLDTVSSPVKEGSAAARFAADASPSNQLVRQVVSVVSGAIYEFSGWIVQDDPAVQAVYLRINWLDQNGNVIIIDDSVHLTGRSPEFRMLGIGPDNAPAAARSAWVEIRVLTNGNFTVYLDAFSLQGHDPTPAPTPSPPPPTQSPTPSPPASPTAAPTLPPTTTATPVPHATPTPGVTAPPPSTTPTPEPRVFAQLINGGFEDRRSHGTPVGWHKFGGEMRTTGAPRTEGDVALAFSSTTGSTKWVYQTVNVEPGVHYEASAYTMPQARSSETFLRVSWYASEDGSGSAIGSDDSTATVSGSASAFSMLSTGPVQAPAGSRSARIRLMLRPGTEAPVTAYFDAVSFGRSGPPAGSSADGGAQQAAAAPTFFADAGGSPSATGVPATATTEEPRGSALSVSQTPAGLANVTPGPNVDERPDAGGGGRDYDWAIIAFGVATPVVGFGLIAAQELRRLRRRD